MKKLPQHLRAAVLHREKIRQMAPDITDADIATLKDFKPKLTAAAAAVRGVFRR